jgi:hypothetical protein
MILESPNGRLFRRGHQCLGVCACTIFYVTIASAHDGSRNDFVCSLMVGKSKVREDVSPVSDNLKYSN